MNILGTKICFFYQIAATNREKIADAHRFFAFLPIFCVQYLLYNIFFTIFAPANSPCCLDGGMVDTGDLKSPGPKRPCGFESHSRYNIHLHERL